MERRRRSPDGFIIALRVLGAPVLTTIEPWRAKDIIAETIGIGKAEIKEIRTTRKRVTAAERRERQQRDHRAEKSPQRNSGRHELNHYKPSS